jgi:hypothetical protein
MRFFTQPYAENWSMFSAASVLACLPIRYHFLFLQNTGAGLRKVPEKAEQWITQRSHRIRKTQP